MICEVNIYPVFVLILLQISTHVHISWTNEQTDDLPFHKIVNAFVLMLSIEVASG